MSVRRPRGSQIRLRDSVLKWVLPVHSILSPSATPHLYNSAMPGRQMEVGLASCGQEDRGRDLQNWSLEAREWKSPGNRVFPRRSINHCAVAIQGRIPGCAEKSRLVWMQRSSFKDLHACDVRKV